MIENWKALLLTFVVGAFVYLFSAATTEYREIRKDIVKEAAGYSEQDGNTLRFSNLATTVAERGGRRAKSLRALEHDAPTEQGRIDSAILALKEAEGDCNADIALLSGFSTSSHSIKNAQELFLAVFKAENELRNAVIVALKLHTLEANSPDIAALDAQLVQRAQMLHSALGEEKGQLNDLEELATNSIREYNSRYKVLGIKILSAFLFVIVGTSTLIVTFLRERNRKIVQDRFDQGLSA